MSDTPQGEGWWKASDGRWYPPQQAGAVPPAPSPSVPPAPVSSGSPVTPNLLLLGSGGALFLSLVGALVLGTDDEFFTSVKIELATWVRDLGLLAAAVLGVVLLLPRVLDRTND